MVSANSEPSNSVHAMRRRITILPYVLELKGVRWFIAMIGVVRHIEAGFG
jgi:hypothetical protein